MLLLCKTNIVCYLQCTTSCTDPPVIDPPAVVTVHVYLPASLRLILLNLTTLTSPSISLLTILLLFVSLHVYVLVSLRIGLHRHSRRPCRVSTTGLLEVNVGAVVGAAEYEKNISCFLFIKILP